MKIGIMSDSHDHLENINKSMKMFGERAVDLVIHLGDFVNPNSVRALKGLPLVAIFGNNDGDKFRMQVAFGEIGGDIKGDFYDFETGTLKCACYHGTEPQLTDALIECGKYDVVMFGHTHECVNSTMGKTIILNPGTVHGFGNHATVMIFDTGRKSADIITL